MIITCEECTTRFKLDDARIPAKGAKVRCSKCKHAFFVKPETRAGDPVENAVSQALAEDDVQTKELSGQGDSAEFDEPDDSSASLRAPDSQSAQAAMDELEESDWEFNTGQEAAAGERLDGHQESEGLDLGGDDVPIPDLGEDTGSQSDFGDASSFGDEESGSSDLRDQIGESTDLREGASASSDLGDPSSLDLDDPPGLDLEGPSGLDLDGDSEAQTQPHAGPDLLAEEPVAAAPDAETGDAAAEAVEGLLGGLDDDDDELFDTQPGAVDRGIDALLDDAPDEADGPLEASGLDIDPVAAPAPPQHDPVDAALDGLGLDAAESRSPAPTSELPDGPPVQASAPEPARAELGEPGEWDFFGGDGESKPAPPAAATAPIVIGRIGTIAPETRPRPRPPVEVDVEPTLAGVWGRRAVHAAGWTAMTALSALILFQSLWAAPRSQPVASSSQMVAGLTASGVAGHWVEKLDGRSIYLVSGELRSASGTHTPGSRLAVRLLDGSGAIVLEEAADVGAALPIRELRESSGADLRAVQTRRGKALAWQAFIPGRGLPFAAVLEEIPAGAQRFELVALPAPRPAVERTADES